MNKYLDLLNKLQEKPPSRPDDHIVIIDALNTFIRNFVTLKSMNPGGHHVGGLLGFLRSLGYLTRTLDPTRIVCVFDGKGSSMNRKNIDPMYKAQREHVKITNWGMYDTQLEERESMAAQIDRLMDYLECLPVTVLIYDKIEADDVISFVAQEKAQSQARVTIVSSDKDFYQIIRPGIAVYSPIKRQLIDHQNVSEILGLTPVNYLTAKAVMGDNSDNLAGVKGVGLKTLTKVFPELLSEERFELQDLYNVCEQKLENRRKIYANVIYDWEKVQRNYQLMDIQNPRLTQDEKSSILQDIKHPRGELNIRGFLKYMEVDRIEAITANTEGWLEELFKPLTNLK
jgi:DNA polymerase I